MTTANREAINQDTKDIIGFFKDLLECYVYEGEDIDEDFLKDLKTASRKSPKSFSKGYILAELIDDGYITKEGRRIVPSFERFEFIGAMMMRGLTNVDWGAVDSFLLTEAPGIAPHVKRAAWCSPNK